MAVLYLPATQAVQTPPSAPVKPTLQVQEARAELASGELELVGHARQAVATVAPVVVKYVPAAQLVHTALPVAVLYVPAAQSVHGALPVAVLYLPATQAVHGPDPSGPEKPTLHVQAATAELAIGELELVRHARQVAAAEAPVVVEYVPAAQSKHTALPVAALYLPATQAVHGPDPSGPEKPTLHVQAATAELAIGELELVGHVRQVAAAEAPVVVKYVPAAQSKHTALPVAALYLPATQAMHVLPSGPL